MILNVRRWGGGDSERPMIVCLHGVAQHGGIYRALARQLEEFELVALDLRGHGQSCKEPPWNVQAHVADVRETVEALGREPFGWIAHSFGGRVALSLRSASPDLVRRLVLLEPGLRVDAETALRKAEVERLDWSFASEESALRALIGGNVPEAAHSAIREFVASDLVRGADNRLRFSFSPAAVVVAWSEMTLSVAPVTGRDMLVVLATQTVADGWSERAEYAWLDGQAQIAKVPNGHNVPWEAPDEAASIIRAFMAACPAVRSSEASQPVGGYQQGTRMQPLF